MSDHMKALMALQVEINQAQISDEEWAALTQHVSALLSFVREVG